MTQENYRVYLRPLQAEDINDDYLSWFRDDEVTAFLDSRNISREDAVRHLEEGRRNNSYFMYAIIDRETGLHIGNLKLGPINWKHRYSDLVTVIGRREFWGKGLASEAIRQAIRIAFEEHDLRKLSAGIIEGNEGSVKAYTSAGFSIEGRLVGQFLINGESRDRIEIGCFNPRYFPDKAEPRGG